MALIMPSIGSDGYMIGDWYYKDLINPYNTIPASKKKTKTLYGDRVIINSPYNGWKSFRNHLQFELDSWLR